jgi:hypothetical protein
MGSDVSIGLVLRYSSKRGAGADMCVVCFVESIVHYSSLRRRFRAVFLPLRRCRCVLLSLIGGWLELHHD